MLNLIKITVLSSLIMLFNSGIVIAASSFFTYHTPPFINLEPESGFSESYKTAATIWLPDWQWESRGFSKRTENDKGGTDIIGECGSYGFVVSCGYPKISTGSIRPKVDLTCQKSCICPSSYQYTSSNCNGNYQLSGGICEGKYNSCICKPDFKYNSSNCSGSYQVNGISCGGNYNNCICKPEFKYNGGNCSGNYTVSGTTCNGNYNSCICKPEFKYTSGNCNGNYQVNGTSCNGSYNTCICKPQFKYNSSNCNGQNQPSGTSCGGNYSACTCKAEYRYSTSNCSGEYQLSGSSCGGNYNSCVGKPCSAGGYYPSAQANQKCSTLSYGGNTCYSCYRPSCSEGGYDNSAKTGYICSAVSYYSSTCYNCKKDPCYNLTEVSIPANASCSGKYEQCQSKCSAWSCNSGYINSQTYWCSVPVTDCNRLGYNQTAANCTGQHIFYCPFDRSKLSCVNF